MKSSNNRPFLSTLLLTALFLAAANAEARSPRAREWCGVLEQIGPQGETLKVRSSKGNKPLEVLWKKETRFVHNGKFDSAAALKPGERVCVYYHSPFFGRPFASKVVWGNASNPP